MAECAWHWGSAAEMREGHVEEEEQHPGARDGPERAQNLLPAHAVGDGHEKAKHGLNQRALEPTSLRRTRRDLKKNK